MTMSFPLWSIHIQQWNNPDLDKSVDSVRIRIPLGPEMPIVLGIMTGVCVPKSLTNPDDPLQYSAPEPR